MDTPSREPGRAVDLYRPYEPTLMPTSLHGPTLGVDLRDIGPLLRQKIWWIFLAIILGAILGVAAGRLLPKRYIVEGLLVIDTRELGIPELQGIRSARTVEPWGARSEARILASRDLVSNVVAKLDLMHDPDFNTTLRTLPFANWLTKEGWIPQSWIAGVQPEPDFGPETQERVLRDISKDLAAFSEERSYAITVRYTGRNAETSAKLTNELMESYVNQDVRAKRRALDQARNQLKQRLDELRSDLQASQSRIRALERQRGVIETFEGTISAQQAASVGRERRTLATERAAVEADLAQIEASLASNRVSVINERLVTPSLKALWQSEAALQRKMAENSASVGSTHPRMVQTERELQKIKSELRSEAIAIRDGLRTRAAVLRMREDVLERQNAAAEDSATASADGRTLLTQLKADAVSKQTLYDQYRSRYEQTVANAELISADARIVSFATPPVEPTLLPMGLRALIGSLIGLVASIGLIVWRRWLRNGVETSAEAQDVCGVMSLGSIPKVGSWWRRVSVADHVLAEPDGIVAERIRNVLYGVRFSHVRPRLKVVMVTSPLSQDGKSTLVAAMARVGAREGLRCLAVDCDFYRPSLARMIKVTPNVYLNEPQARTAKLADLVVADPASGAHFILAEPSSGRSDPLSLEGTPLGRIIEDARDIYDLVIIDTPPVLKVIDPLVLSQSADGTVLVLPYRTVSRKVIREVMQRLAVFTCPVIGVVLSRVEGQSFRSYGYRRYDLAKT